MKNFLVIAILILAPLKGIAAGWSNNVTIEKLYILHEDRAIVKLSAFTNPNECMINSNGDIFFNPGTDKAWFSSLLSAYMAKTKISVYVTSECVPLWSDTSYAKIGHIVLN